MKKFLYLSLALMCCIVLGASLTSCSDDDEPIIKSNIEKTELTTPMFLFENPQSGVVSSITNGFSFWTFTADKAAYGNLSFVGNRAVLKCSEMYNTWSLTDGRLNLGEGTSYGQSIKEVNVLGVKAFTIGLKVYIPSNLSVAGFKGESVFINLSVDKEKLWRGLEKARQDGIAYIDEL